MDNTQHDAHQAEKAPLKRELTKVLGGFLKQKRAFLTTTLIVFLLIPLAAWVYLSLLPAFLQQPLPVTVPFEEVADSVAKDQHKDTLHISKQLMHAELQANVLRNRMQLANGDSVYMIVNLADSTIELEIKGLVVHKAKAQQLDYSQRIPAAGYEAIRLWTTTPFTLQQELSSIPKSPILVVEAPKDTAAAATLPRKPLEPEKSAVQFTLIFDRSLVLEIQQLEMPNPEDEAALSIYNQANDSIFHRSVFKQILKPFSSDDPIRIRMQLPAADARAIYRAIPHIGNAKLVLDTGFSESK